MHFFRNFVLKIKKNEHILSRASKELHYATADHFPFSALATKIWGLLFHFRTINLIVLKFNFYRVNYLIKNSSTISSSIHSIFCLMTKKEKENYIDNLNIDLFEKAKKIKTTDKNYSFYSINNLLTFENAVVLHLLFFID